MKYTYLYQDRENVTHEGVIEARDRSDAFLRLRRQGIRPFRVIGDDPWNWRPWAVAGGYCVLLTIISVLVIMLFAMRSSAPRVVEMTAAEAVAFRQRAQEAVNRAPDNYRYNVWKGVNARLIERGLEPIEKPVGLMEDDGLETR